MDELLGYDEMSGRDFLLRLSRLGAVLVSDRSGGFLARDSHGGEEDEPPEMEDESSEPMEEDAPEVSPSPSSGPVPSCSFLFPGRTFTGQQRLTGPHREQEDWAVTATIYSCDFARGRLTGSLVAQNNPHSKRPIVTYFEGDIIDNVNHTFWTGRKWGTCPSRDTDVRYWGRCPGFDAELRAAVQRHDGCAPQLGASRFVFMRWKECFFVDVPQDCPLTITGFYYLSLDRTDGSIGGYYHDTRSAPLQVLQLRPVEMCGGEDGPSAAGAGAAAAAAAAAAGGPSSSSSSAGCGPGTRVPGEAPAGMAFGCYSLC